MPFRRSLAPLLLLVLFTTSSATAGPIFHLIGTSPLTLPHPTGIGGRTASASFVIVSTGSGFMDASLEFTNDFVLPGVGGVMPFDASDLARVTFAHQTNAFTGAPSVLPSFAWEATNGPGGNQIVSAVGQVVGGGTLADPTWTINFLNQPVGDPDPPIRTSVPFSTFAGCCGAGGTWSGLSGLDGDTFVLYDASLNGVGGQANQFIVVNSQYPGTWRLTSIPEPSTALLVGLGLAGLARRGRR